MKSSEKTIVFYALLASLLVSTISIYIHHPDTPVFLNVFGFKYSDIVHGVFTGIFTSSSRWYSSKYYELLHERTIVYPYVDYFLEYPPIVGLTWFISTNIGLALALPKNYDAYTYFTRLNKVVSIHYSVHAVINSTAFMLTVLVTFDLIKKTNSSVKKLFLYILPSTVIYMVYNWDVLCSLFTLLGLKYFIERKYFKTGLFLGLSFSTKLLTLPVLILVLVDFVKKRLVRKSIYTLLGFLVGGVAPFIIVYVVSPHWLFDFINYHYSWYCENCLYQLFTLNIFSVYNRVLATVFVSLSILITLYVYYRYNYLNIVKACFTILALTISLNYVFSPQMILLLTPLAVITLSNTLTLMYIVADVLNALIILLFFKDLEIRMWLNSFNIPISVEYNPWSLPSLVQLVAIARIITLLIISTKMLLGSVFKILYNEIRYFLKQFSESLLKTI